MQTTSLAVAPQQVARDIALLCGLCTVQGGPLRLHVGRVGAQPGCMPCIRTMHAASSVPSCSDLRLRACKKRSLIF